MPSEAKPILLDLFCGAGGCAVGYDRAGFDVVGVDIAQQPNYPYEFIHADAVELMECWLDGITWRGRRLADFDAIHASPPCQAYSVATRRSGTPDRHPDLVAPTRELLIATGLPYVIENVPGAPMRAAVQLCGSSFRLRVRRHRLFECSFPVMAPPCAHGWQRSNNNRLRAGYVPPEDSIVPVYGGGQAGFDVVMCRAAMGIDWMTTDELNNAIPPAYTEHIGGYLMADVQRRALELAA